MRGREEGKTAAWTENPEGRLMEFPSRPQDVDKRSPSLYSCSTGIY